MLKKIIILVLIITAAVFLYWQNLNTPVNSAGKEQLFIVNKGETAQQVALNLKKENLIRSASYFEHYIKAGELIVLAGEYSLSPKLTTKEITKLLAAGEVLSQEKTITLIEGWNIKDMAAYLQEKKVTPAASFISAAEKPLSAWKFDWLSDAPKGADLEGYLFPDTYRIAKDATAEQIINKLLSNFDKKLTPTMRAEIKQQGKTVYEIITMASVIEKEVRTPEDMKIVSGIFWDRIKYGIALQSDATLSYILDDKVGGHTIEQTKIDSPYNTYKYRGLPPGPIANPGLNAITAAVYPGFTEYVYFLSDPATGKTIYSKTLQEHNANKYKYLK